MIIKNILVKDSVIYCSNNKVLVKYCYNVPHNKVLVNTTIIIKNTLVKDSVIYCPNNKESTCKIFL